MGQVGSEISARGRFENQIMENHSRIRMTCHSDLSIGKKCFEWAQESLPVRAKSTDSTVQLKVREIHDQKKAAKTRLERLKNLILGQDNNN